jgi:hypothetical protein
LEGKDTTALSKFASIDRKNILHPIAIGFQQSKKTTLINKPRRQITDMAPKEIVSIFKSIN